MHLELGTLESISQRKTVQYLCPQQDSSRDWDPNWTKAMVRQHLGLLTVKAVYKFPTGDDRRIPDVMRMTPGRVSPAGCHAANGWPLFPNGTPVLREEWARLGGQDLH